jgi:ERCC4-type nuclease
MEIIVDDRERAVSPFFEDLSDSEHIEYRVKRLEVGDYAICYKGYIMIIIERKSLADLAASMRDGRKANLAKLIALREATGCQIAYLIEGNPFTAEDKLVSRIPMKNLTAHLDHIAFRDGIHMLWANNPQGCAQRLFTLSRNYSTIKPSPFADVEVLIAEEKEEAKNNPDTADADHNPDDTDHNPDDPADKMQATGGGGNTALLTDKKINEVKQISIQEQLLQCLPGVGSIVSTLLAEQNVTLRGIYQGAYTAEVIARIKFPTGKSIGLERANKIVDCKKIFTSTSQIARKTHVRILATIPKISRATAEKILGTVSLADILSGNTTCDVLRDIARSEKSKLGESAAKSILQYMCGA